MKKRRGQWEEESGRTFCSNSSLSQVGQEYMCVATTFILPLKVKLCVRSCRKAFSGGDRSWEKNFFLDDFVISHIPGIYIYKKRSTVLSEANHLRRKEQEEEKEEKDYLIPFTLSFAHTKLPFSPLCAIVPVNTGWSVQGEINSLKRSQLSQSSRGQKRRLFWVFLYWKKKSLLSGQFDKTCRMKGSLSFVCDPFFPPPLPCMLVPPRKKKVSGGKRWKLKRQGMFFFWYGWSGNKRFGGLPLPSNKRLQFALPTTVEPA